MSSGAWSSEQEGRRSAQGPIQAQRSEMEEHVNTLFVEGVGDKSEEKITYKPPTASSTRAASGNKSQSTMGNGKDFWTELRRQATALAEKEKSGG